MAWWSWLSYVMTSFNVASRRSKTKEPFKKLYADFIEFGYATAMRSMSQGRATFTMEFDHYAEAPNSIADAVIKKN